MGLQNPNSFAMQQPQALFTEYDDAQAREIIKRLAASQQGPQIATRAPVSTADGIGLGLNNLLATVGQNRQAKHLQGLYQDQMVRQQEAQYNQILQNQRLAEALGVDPAIANADKTTLNTYLTQQGQTDRDNLTRQAKQDTLKTTQDALSQLGITGPVNTILSNSDTALSALATEQGTVGGQIQLQGDVRANNIAKTQALLQQIIANPQVSDQQRQVAINSLAAMGGISDLNTVADKDFQKGIGNLQFANRQPSDAGFDFSPLTGAAQQAGDVLGRLGNADPNVRNQAAGEIQGGLQAIPNAAAQFGRNAIDTYNNYAAGIKNLLGPLAPILDLQQQLSPAAGAINGLNNLLPNQGVSQQPGKKLRGSVSISAPKDNAFLKNVKSVLGFEGGFVDDPADKGGATNFGISSAAHPDVDVRNLTKAQATQIYHDRYWKPSGAAELSDPALQTVVFDTAVNSGVGTAKKLLSESGGDANRYLDLRQQFVNRIVQRDPSQRKFLQGWTNRINRLRKEIGA